MLWKMFGSYCLAFLTLGFLSLLGVAWRIIIKEWRKDQDHGRRH